MRKTVLVAFLGLLLPLSLVAQGNKFMFNTGLKIGVQANTYHNTQFELDGWGYNNKSQNTRIGYTLSAFFRLSKGRPFVQTEALLSTAKSNFSFEPKVLPENVLQEVKYPRYKLTTNSIQVPFFLGYYFVDSAPYKMAVYMGPKAQFIFTTLTKQQFDDFEFSTAKEYLEPLTFSWALGLEVSIANICFNFMYELGMNNTSKYLYIPENNTTFHFNRNVNALSFSLGVIL